MRGKTFLKVVWCFYDKYCVFHEDVIIYIYWPYEKFEHLNIVLYLTISVSILINKYDTIMSDSDLTLVLLNCFNCIFRHSKLELLTRFPASNDEKYYYLWKKYMSKIKLLDQLSIY